MAFLITRQEWRARLVRESHRQGDSGTASLPDQNRILQDSYNEWSDDLVTASPRSAIGKSHRTLTVTTDSDTVDMPSEFRALFGFRRSDAVVGSSNFHSLSRPKRILQDVALHAGLLAPDPPVCPPDFQGAYYLEGPGQEFDVGSQQLVTFPLRIRLFPRLPANQSITIVYRTQPLFLGDPEVLDTGVDLDTIEFLSAANYAAVTAQARIVFSQRADQGELQRAIGARQTAIQQFLASVASEDSHGSIGVDQFAIQGQSTAGYG